MAIGQGALTVTPLQLARAIGGLAIGGVWHHPHLLKALDQTDKPTEWSLNPDNVKDVVDGMYGVVNEWRYGSGARNCPESKSAAKPVRRNWPPTIM